MSQEREPRRLPPPAFPPGSRRKQAAGPNGKQDGAAPPAGRDAPDQVFEDALILPEQPASWGGDDLGLISPDEPLPDREGDPDEGVVTSIGNDPHLGPEDVAAGRDPHVRELVVTLSKLAESVRRKGEPGLRVTPEMSRFESTLRAYCLGYLVGRRSEDGAPGRDQPRNPS